MKCIVVILRGSGTGEGDGGSVEGGQCFLALLSDASKEDRAEAVGTCPPQASL